jgi:hypothetical protein
VTDAHKAIEKHMEQEATDKFLALRATVFLIPILAIFIAHGDLAVFDAVIGEHHTVGVAAEVIEHGLSRAERLFRVDVSIVSA